MDRTLRSGSTGRKEGRAPSGMTSSGHRQLLSPVLEARPRHVHHAQTQGRNPDMLLRKEEERRP